MTRYAWILVLVAAGCSKPAQTVVDAGAEALAETIVDAGPPPQMPLDVRVEFDVPDAGMQQVLLEPGQKIVGVPVAVRIDFATNQPIHNYRVRLFDEIDKVVPSNDTAEDFPDRLRYSLVPEAPLKTGYRYAVVFDAQTGAAMLDALGRPISDLRYEFVVAGERQKPAPPPKKKAAKKKRR